MVMQSISGERTQGLLQSNQTEIVSTRNGRVITESLSGERTMTKRGENINSTTTGINDEPIIDPQKGSLFNYHLHLHLHLEFQYLTNRDRYYKR